MTLPTIRDPRTGPHVRMLILASQRSSVNLLQRPGLGRCVDGCTLEQILEILIVISIEFANLLRTLTGLDARKILGNQVSSPSLESKCLMKPFSKNSHFLRWRRIPIGALRGRSWRAPYQHFC